VGNQDTRREWLKCQRSVAYFVHNYCWIYDATTAVWVPFHLWREQAGTLKTVDSNNLTVILKARQLGMTWLILCYALWLMLFHPASTILIFSRREDEVRYLLERLRGIYKRLPDWAMVKSVVQSNTEVWQLSNGSIAYGFPTTAGDSYTATFAMVDEADLVPDLQRLMNAVKPTIDGGGKMVLLSRVDKSVPESLFKRIYKGARDKLNSWVSVFLPWYVRPDRDAAWYEAQKLDSLTNTGSMDNVYEQYPATDEEALAPKELDKRIPYKWASQCYIRQVSGEDILGIPGLRIYKLPTWDGKYFISGDPAEGNPTSDPSAMTIMDSKGEECAAYSYRAEPAVFAAYLDQIGHYFNNAKVMIERNNHGHAVLLWLGDHSTLELLKGLDGNPGWMSSSKGKALGYATTADSMRDLRVTIHDQQTFDQLVSVEGGTLRAPEGLFDDLAISFMIATQAALGVPEEKSAGYSYRSTSGYKLSRRERLIAHELHQPSEG